MIEGFLQDLRFQFDLDYDWQAKKLLTGNVNTPSKEILTLAKISGMQEALIIALSEPKSEATASIEKKINELKKSLDLEEMK